MRTASLGVLLFVAAFVGMFAFLHLGDEPGSFPPIGETLHIAPDETVASAGRPDTQVSAAANGLVVPAAAGRPPPISGADSGASRNAMRFSVGVMPLMLEDDDQRVLRAYRSLYDRFLAELRSIEHLDLLVLDERNIDLLAEDADFIVQLRGMTRLVPEPEWSVYVSWSATRGGTGNWSATSNASDPEGFEAIAVDAAAALRRYPFPPEENRILRLESAALDTNLTDDERYDAIDELRDVPRRFEFVGRDEMHAVVVAAVEIVANAGEPEIRGRVWKAMGEAGAEDTYLTGPLVDSLLNDTNEYVRLEAIKLLARTFSDDPRAHAALEFAILRDPSATVRAHARWQGLDDPGRRAYVSTTLLNDGLSNAERLELLIADVPEAGDYVDQSTATRLLNSSMQAWDLLLAADEQPYGTRSDADRVVPKLLEMLVDEDNVPMRVLAASMLIEYSDIAGVEEALEEAARSQSTFSARVQMQFVLARVRAAAPGDRADDPEP